MLRRGAPRNLPRASCPERQTDLQRQRALKRRRGCPTDDASAEEVLETGQVERTLARWQVGDVGAPDAVGKMRLGVPLQDVRGGWQRSIRRGRPGPRARAARRSVRIAARTRSTVGAASAMSRLRCSAVGGRPPTRWSSFALRSDSACTRNWMWIGRELERRRLRRSAEEFERLAHEGMQAR